jgi:hypothetical protein
VTNIRLPVTPTISFAPAFFALIAAILSARFRNASAGAIIAFRLAGTSSQGQTRLIERDICAREVGWRA